MTQRILLFGADGQLGRELRRQLQAAGELVPMTRALLDLRRHEAIGPCITASRAAIVVNAAGFTAVDRAERAREEAFALNAKAVAVMARACRATGALFVHFSSDYVFDGQGGAPYPESAPAAPLNVYGVSKLRGDLAVVESGCRHLVLRTGGVYSLHGRNFLRAILAQARAGQALRVVDEQRAAPTPAWLLAALSAQLIGRSEAGAIAPGLFNLTCTGSCSWYEFALAVFDYLDAHPECRRRFGVGARPAIVAISSKAYRSAAPRPVDTRLALDRILAAGLQPPHWRDALALTLADRRQPRQQGTACWM